MASKSRVRELAIQICYQAWFSGYPLPKVFRLFWASMDDDKTTRKLAEILVTEVTDMAEQLDLEISAYLKNWTLDRVVVLDRIILRIAFYELMEKPEIPPRVVIDEAMRQAHAFSSDKSATFINGLLHAWAVRNRDMDSAPRQRAAARRDARIDAAREEAPQEVEADPSPEEVQDTEMP